MPRVGLVAFNPRDDAFSDSIVAAVYASLRSAEMSGRLALISRRDLWNTMDNEFVLRQKDAREFEALGMAARGDALANLRAMREQDHVVVSGILYFPRRPTNGPMPGRSGHAPREMGPWRVRSIAEAGDSVAASVLSNTFLWRRQ